MHAQLALSRVTRSGGIELLFDKRKEVDVDVPCKGGTGAKARPAHPYGSSHC